MAAWDEESGHIEVAERDGVAETEAASGPEAERIALAGISLIAAWRAEGAPLKPGVGLNRDAFSQAAHAQVDRGRPAAGASRAAGQGRDPRRLRGSGLEVLLAGSSGR
jgi:hypothetical protein